PSSLGWRIHGGVCHVCVPEAPRRWEGSWGGAYMAVFCHVCVRWVLVEARTHRKRRAMYAPPRGVGGDQPTWERSRDVPWNQWLHQLRSHRGLGRAKGAKGLGGAYMGGVCHVCVRWVLVEARTHRKKPDVCATRRYVSAARSHRGLVREEDPATLGRMMYDDLFAVPERLF